jgi:hypothetical protein
MAGHRQLEEDEGLSTSRLGNWFHLSNKSETKTHPDKPQQGGHSENYPHIPLGAML